ncbi:MAG: hypothetical protein V4574_00660 [Pseudomonadota bacterium]
MILTALALALAPAPCKTFDTSLPRDLAGWRRLGRTLDTGHAVLLPAKGKAAETNVTIRKAGTFGIAVDQQAWVDVWRGSARPLAMAAESRGPACSTIRKIVRYNLRPGNYRVTVTRIAGARARLMLVHSDARKPHEVLRRYRRHR